MADRCVGRSSRWRFQSHRRRWGRSCHTCRGRRGRRFAARVRAGRCRRRRAGGRSRRGRTWLVVSSASRGQQDRYAQPGGSGLGVLVGRPPGPSVAVTVAAVAEAVAAVVGVLVERPPPGVWVAVAGWVVTVADLAAVAVADELGGCVARPSLVLVTVGGIPLAVGVPSAGVGVAGGSSVATTVRSSQQARGPCFLRSPTRPEVKRAGL